jgi:hypothetical protein
LLQPLDLGDQAVEVVPATLQGLRDWAAGLVDDRLVLVLGLTRELDLAVVALRDRVADPATRVQEPHPGAPLDRVEVERFLAPCHVERLILRYGCSIPPGATAPY